MRRKLKLKDKLELWMALYNITYVDLVWLLLAVIILIIMIL